MGLFRLWWVPADGSAADGAYVRYPAEDLLDIVALESHRAQALVVGEDLGTVEDGVREAMAEHGVLSYRLLWFEDDDPAEWPAAAMAAVTTHDLPTVAGLWTGADLAEQREHGTGHRRGARPRPDVAAGAPARAARRRPARGRRSSGAPPARAGAVHPAVGHPGRRRGRAAPAEHARHHRPAELVAAAAGAGRGPARPPAAAEVAPTLAGGRRGRGRGPTRVSSNACSTAVPHCGWPAACTRAGGRSLGERAADSGVRRCRRPPAAPAVRRPPATPARAGTAGCATRRRRPAPGPACSSSGGQRETWQGRVAYTVAGPHGPALVEAWLPADRLEPR